MKIHEYQAKELLRKFKVPVPPGIVASTPDEAAAAFSELGVSLGVIKAQIHAGGRGKGQILVDGQETGGGIRLAKTADEAREHAAACSASRSVTQQTGPEGKRRPSPSRRGRAATSSASSTSRMVLDRAASGLRHGLAEGGMEIEEVAARNPEAILKEWIDPAFGLLDFQARRLAFGIGLTGEQAKKAVEGHDAARCPEAFAHSTARCRDQPAGADGRRATSSRSTPR
jgi:succinyl-CoA synthetase beta subunit